MGVSGESNAGSLDGGTDRTNVVLIVADDLDWELFRSVPRLADLQSRGTTFTGFTVTDSLCCPSRVSLMRSQYLHNHMVLSNVEETGGGFPAFVARGEEQDCLPTWLQASGVETALFGKYLNQFPRSRKDTYVPPGWSQFASPITHSASYRGYDYTLNINGELRSYGEEESDFFGTVITGMGEEFIRSAPEGFFLMMTPTAPHRPSAFTPEYADAYSSLTAPRSPQWRDKGVNPPSWLERVPAVTDAQAARYDRMWQDRARSAETVADMVDGLFATLAETGRDKNTVVIFVSDNGFHAGAHGMQQGKRSPYAVDSVVPMVVIGPGIPAGAVIDSPVSMVDLAPTITDLVGASAPDWVDGRSFADALPTATLPADWSSLVLTESLRASSDPKDPDYQKFAAPQFAAIRTGDYLYVEYENGDVQLHDLRSDPDELVNIAGEAPQGLLDRLQGDLDRMRSCAGETCRTPAK